MCLEIGAIWAGCQQVHGDVVSAVAGNGKIERLCETHNLHEGRYATAIGDVGLRIGAAGDVVLKFPERSKVFAGGDGHAALAQDARVAHHVVGDRGLLEPGQIVGLQRFGRPDRFLHRPFHVGVGHQRKTFAQMGAHRLYARHIRRQIRSADFHLDGAKALLQIFVRLAQQRLDG